jgi:hypothetical protein
MARNERNDWFWGGFDFALGVFVVFVLVTIAVPVVAFAVFALIEWLR